MIFVFAGGTLGAVIPLSLQNEEDANAQYTTTFERSDDYYEDTDVYIENLANGNTVYLTTGESHSFTTSSTTNYWFIWVSGDNVNYQFYVNGNSAFGSYYYETSDSTTVTIEVAYQEQSFGLTYFDACGGSFLKSDGSHANKVYYADTKIGQYGGVDFYKGNDGEAYCAWFWGPNRWIFPLLVSKDPSAVSYYYDDAGISESYLQFSYNDETWYVSSNAHIFGDSYWNDHTDYQAYMGVDQYGYELHHFDTFDEDGEWSGDEYRTITSWEDLVLCTAEKMLISLDTTTALWEQGFPGGGIQFPDDPYKPFYHFNGWYTSLSGGTQITSSSSKAGYNRTLYAQYYAGYTNVWIDTNCDNLGGRWLEDGDEETVSLQPENSSLDYNDFRFIFNDNGVESVSDLRKSGYHLVGISVCDSSRNRGNRVYSLEELQNGISGITILEDYYNSFGIDPCISRNMYMTFVWEENQYLLTFSDDATGYYEEMWVRYNQEVTIYGITREGYTFQYYESPNCSSFRFNKGTNLVSELVSYGGFEHSNNVNISLIAVWEINTYTLTVGCGYYYSSSGYTATLSAPGCSVTNSSLNQSNATSIVSHTYSTTPVTVTISCPDAYLWIYVDGTCVNQYTNSISWEWIPTSDHYFSWYIRELWIVQVQTDIGISDTYFVDEWDWGWGEPTNGTMMEGMPVRFEASLKAGYLFDGWYNSSGTRVSTSQTYSYGELHTDVSLTAKTKKIYNKVQYDSSVQYFYFEDGKYPQTYAGEQLNNELNYWRSSTSPTVSYYLWINRVYTPIYSYSDGKEYAYVHCENSCTIKLKNYAETYFTAGWYFWFIVEPIRWRVSDYGVSIDYYSDVLYNRFEEAGCVNGVSQHVLDYDAIVPNLSQVSAGWGYVDSLLHVRIRYNDGCAEMLSGEVSESARRRQFDRLNNGSSNIKIAKEDQSYMGIFQASLEDIAKAGITDLRATVTDLTAMLMGVDYGKNAKYSTRDLFDNQNSRCVTEFGLVKNRWLDGLCGIRYAFASTGKSSV